MNHPSNEFTLIDLLKRYFNTDASAERFPVGVGDDAAVRICSEGEQLVFTSDILVENVHFSLEYMTLAEVGFKSIAASVSDCTSMGAIPDSVSLQIVFPRNLENRDWLLNELYSGINEACKFWNFSVIGGDFSGGFSWVIGVTVTGRRKKGASLLYRKGIKSGDSLYVSKFPGGSGIGLELLQSFGRNDISDDISTFVTDHIRPEPSVDLGLKLSEDSSVTAAMDLSDGIAKESLTLAYENNVGLKLFFPIKSLPKRFLKVQEYLKHDIDYYFLNGGEDYSIVFAANSDFDISKYSEFNILRIGTFSNSSLEVEYTTHSGFKECLKRGGWDHC